MSQHGGALERLRTHTSDHNLLLLIERGFYCLYRVCQPDLNAVKFSILKQSRPGSETAPALPPCEQHRSGNRCGHDPKHPHLLDLPTEENRPKFIQEAVRRLRSHLDDLGLLPALNFHPDGRKVRSERRDGIGMLLIGAVTHMDLATGRVGFPTERGFFNYTMDYLAGWSGLGDRRTARSGAAVKDAGYLTVSQMRERLRDGSYRRLSAVKIVSATLFSDLGIRVWFERERTRAKKRLRKKEKAHEKACTTGGAIKLGRQAREKAAKNWQAPVHTVGVGAKIRTRSLDPVSKYLNRLNPEAKALIARLAIDLKMEHPDWSRDKIYAEAKQSLPGVYRSPKSLPT